MNAPATFIDLVRHGECEGGFAFRGSTDVSLTDIGFAQMRTAVAKLNQTWDQVVSSPLKRCRFFAETYCKQQHLPLAFEPRLRELHFGVWEGKKIEDIWADDAERMQAWADNPEQNAPPEGETLASAAARITEALDQLRDSHAGKRVLVVCHGGVVRVALSQLLAMPLAVCNRFDVPYGCVTRLGFYPTEQGTKIKLLAHNVGSV